jgi:hypothetical protein
MPLDTSLQMGSFKLGPFLVDPLGRLLPNAPEATPCVHVRWRGLWVSARLEADAAAGPAGGRLSMSSVIGRVHSTAGPQRHLRAQALDTLRLLVGAMPSGWRMRMLPDHSARVDAARPVALPATATDLLTAMTCFLLDLTPYRDLLAAPGAGFETPGAGSNTAGMVNT